MSGPAGGRDPGAGADAAAVRPRVFFGWYIVAAGLVTNLVMGAGLVGYVPGVFLEPMTEELGWSRTEFIAAFFAGQFVMAFAGFAVGGLIDRHGGRQLMLWGTAVTVATLLLTAEVQELWQWWLLRGVVQAAGIAIGGALVVNVALAKWFVVRRGRAIAIAAMGLSLAGAVVPICLPPVVDELGWRAAWRLLAVATALLVLPAALLMRRQPEDHGLLPDGRVAGGAGEAAAAAEAREDYARSLTRAQAVRTSAFWLMVVAFGLIGLNLLALATQAIPFLTDAGFERGTAALMLSLLALPGLLTRPLWGLAAGFLTVGSGMAGFVPVQEVLWASLFGRRHLGAVRGVVMPFQLVFGAAGPIALSLYYDVAGSYDGILIAMAGFAVLAAVLMQLVRDPVRTAAPSEAAATVEAVASAGR